MLHGDYVLKYAERKCVSQIRSLQILTSEKCRVSLKEIIAVATAERITQTMDDCKFFCQNKYSIIIEYSKYRMPFLGSMVAIRVAK